MLVCTIRLTLHITKTQICGLCVTCYAHVIKNLVIYADNRIFA